MVEPKKPYRPTDRVKWCKINDCNEKSDFFAYGDNRGAKPAIFIIFATDPGSLRFRNPRHSGGPNNNHFDILKLPFPANFPVGGVLMT